MEQYHSVFLHSTLLHLCSVSLWAKWTKDVCFSLGYMTCHSDSVKLPLPFWPKCTAKVTCDLGKVDGISLWGIWDWILFNKFPLGWPVKTQFQSTPLLVETLLLDEHRGSRKIVGGIVILSFRSGLSLESTEVWILEELLIQFHTKYLHYIEYDMYHCNNPLCHIKKSKQVLQYKDSWWIYHFVVHFLRQPYPMFV